MSRMRLSDFERLEALPLDSLEFLEKVLRTPNGGEKLVHSIRAILALRDGESQPVQEKPIRESITWRRAHVSSDVLQKNAFENIFLDNPKFKSSVDLINALLSCGLLSQVPNPAHRLSKRQIVDRAWKAFSASAGQERRELFERISTLNGSVVRTSGYQVLFNAIVQPDKS